MTEPVLRIIRGGEPTDTELAAMVAVLTARPASGEQTEPRALREPLPPWVASGLPTDLRLRYQSWRNTP